MSTAVPGPAPAGPYAADLAALRRLRERGWHPRCIYDVGASNGAWSQSVAEEFPLASYHLFEPLAEAQESYRHVLDWLVRQRGISATVHPVALDAGEADVNLGVSDDPVGSSLLVGTPMEGFPTVFPVRTHTLDGYRRKRRLPPPDLLKIDTQGLELRVLRGAEETLGRVEALLLETWVVRGYGPGTPLMHEVLAWLWERGFSVLDFAGEYREPRGGLVSVDVLLGRREAFGPASG